MPRRTDTRARVVQTTAELLHTQGYHATGLNQVLAESGAPKGSLYFHFPGGKEELAVESLGAAASNLADIIAGTLADADNPAAGVQRLVDMLADSMVASDFSKGCPVATVALETAAHSEPIRSACVAAYASWATVLADYFVSHGAEPARARSLATVVLASVEGAQLLAKTRRDVAPLHAVGEYLRTTVEHTLDRKEPTA
jgi:TetR/AcrR family transcriptional repressor of lmrAB and yxaGH operons